MSNTNFIHPKAILGIGTTVGHFTTIYEDVIIGENTWIGPNVTIFPGSRIGSNCSIFPGAVIGAIPQDLKFGGEYSTVEVGDKVVIRECVTINRGTIATGTTKVGSGTLLMAYVHIAHDCVVGKNCVLANTTNLAGHVSIGDYAIFGGMSAAHQFVNIGEYAFIAGGTLLRKDVPPFVLVAKEPAMFSGINSVGLKRNNFSLDQIHTIQDIYRYIFGNGMNISQAIEKIKEDFPDDEIRIKILSFISKSERGIIRGIYAE